LLFTDPPVTFQEYQRCLKDWIEQQHFTVLTMQQVGEHYYEMDLQCHTKEVAINPVFNVLSIRFDHRQVSVWTSLELFLDEASEFVDHWKYINGIE